MKMQVAFRYFFFALLPLLILTPKLLLLDPPPWPDEAYFVNTAEHIATSGRMVMSLYKDIAPASPHLRAYSYPPLYLYLLAVWTKVFSTSIGSIRLLSVMLSVIALFIWFHLAVQLTKKYFLAAISVLVLAIFPPFSLTSHVGRMDMLVLVGIVGSIWGIAKNRPWLAGMAATIAILAHPVGLLALLYPTLSLLSEKNRRGLLLFSIPLVIGFLIWMGVVADRFDLFLEHLKLQVFYKSGRTPILHLLFANDGWWRITLLAYLVIGAAATVIGWIEKQRHLLVFGMATFLTVLGVSATVDQWYLVFLPVFPLLSILFLAGTHRYRLGVGLLLLIGLLHATRFLPATSAHLTSTASYDNFATALLSQIPEHATVALSVVPEPYFVLRTRQDLTLYQVPHVTEKGKLEELLRSSTLVIHNYTTNNELPRYLEAHTEKKVTISQPGGYTADIYFLK